MHARATVATRELKQVFVCSLFSFHACFSFVLFVRLFFFLGDYINFCEVGTGRMVEKEIIAVNKYKGFR
jgi:hypothetical protein